MSEVETSRRNVLFGVAAAGVALPVIAACGSESKDATGTTEPEPGAGTSSEATDTPAAAIKTTDIPVGSGEIIKDQNIVVTQPTEGEFKAFSATCTHQGCQVASVSEDLIHCPCHGSTFNIADGSPAGGPARSPLKEKKVTVTGDSLTVG